MLDKNKIKIYKVLSESLKQEWHVLSKLEDDAVRAVESVLEDKEIEIPKDFVIKSINEQSGKIIPDLYCDNFDYVPADDIQIKDMEEGRYYLFHTNADGYKDAYVLKKDSGKLIGFYMNNAYPAHKDYYVIENVFTAFDDFSESNKKGYYQYEVLDAMQCKDKTLTAVFDENGERYNEFMLKYKPNPKGYYVIDSMTPPTEISIKELNGLYKKEELKFDYYKISVVETLSKDVNVKAKSQEEAEKIAKGMYDNEYIVLSADDHVDTDISVMKIKRARDEHER